MMSDLRIYPRHSILEFIRLYKNTPVLWRTGHRFYHNKRKKAEAYSALVQLMAKTDQSANRDAVVRKINSLRCCFRKEYNKVKKSIESGATGGEVHKPSLWYYDEMKFVAENDDAAASKSDQQTLLSSDEQPPAEESNVFFCKEEPEADLDDDESEEGQLYIPTETVKIENPIAIPSTSSQVHIEPCDTTATNEVDFVFGQYVAQRLAGMPKATAIICRKLINDAIYEGEMGNLRRSSRINI